MLYLIKKDIFMFLKNNLSNRNTIMVTQLENNQRFLIKHSVITSLILIGLYWLFSYSAIILAAILRFNLFYSFHMDKFLMVFSFLAILLLVIVPRGLNLPNGKQSLKEYAESIRISPFNPWKRNIFLGLGFAAIVWTFTLIFSLLAGEYIFDLNIIFGWPESNNIGIFLFISSLIPGIWEEVAFRGVILTLLVKKYSEKKAIIINGVLFGFAHVANIFGGQDIGSTIIQMIYATFWSFSFAYMYIKTKSLIPGIIAHYLIDAVNPLFLNVIIGQTILVLIYLVFFIFILPPFLTIMLVKIIMKRETEPQ